MEQKHLLILMFLGIFLVTLNFVQLYRREEKNKFLLLNHSYDKLKKIDLSTTMKSKREYILSKNFLTKFDDLKITQQLKKVYSQAQYIQSRMKSKLHGKFNVSDFPFRNIQVPFRNTSFYLIYTKAEVGIINSLRSERLCVYEPATLIALSQVIKPNFKIIDCGSHFGQYTLKMAALLEGNKGGKIYTFEPNPISIQFVNVSLLVNGFDTQAELYNYAIYNQTKEMTFNLYLRGYQSAIDSISQQRKSKGIQIRADEEKEFTQTKVLAISLDDFFPPEVLPEVHLIKLDIENAEIMGIEGAHQLIQRSKDVIIIME